MNISVENLGADVPVTVVRLAGELDGSNYRDLINRVDALYREGTRRLLLDLSELSFLSSAGLVALHSMALTMRGEKPVDTEAGWDAFHTMQNDVATRLAPEATLKLVNPQPRVARTLEMSGFTRLFATLPDVESGLTSFGVTGG